MLIAAIRTGHALAGKAVTYNDEDGRFWLSGVGEIPAARLIEYDERRELDWADDVTREWALEMAAILARKLAAEQQQQAAAAAAAAAEAARLEALAPPSVVYQPPDTSPPRPEGIPAVRPGFELSTEARDRPPRWVVWAEAAPPPDPSTGQAAAPQPVADAREESGGATSAVPRQPAPTGDPQHAGDPQPAGTAAPQTPASAGTAAVVKGADAHGQIASVATPAPTARSERRSAKHERGRRARGSGAGLRIAVYVVVAAAAAAALYVIQRGGF